ncbi:MAG: hypothetical protein ABI806_26650 [Candidatus Solibacter sp.]
MSRREKIVAGTGIAVLLVAIGIVIAGARLSHRIEPYIRQRAEDYLRTRFNADVQIGALRITLPRLSPLRMVFTKGKGTVAAVEGENIVMRTRGAGDRPPLFRIQKFVTGINIGNLFDTTVHVPVVAVTGLEINIPPREQKAGTPSAPDTADKDDGPPKVVIDRVEIKSATLYMLPRDTGKRPLRFDIHDLRLQSAGPGVAMKYDAMLTNPKPPGEIHSVGGFGPWNAGDPGDTQLAGDFTFDHADLGVFQGVAGILSSTGRFEGQLDSITARGEAYVPDFRLKRSGNSVPLRTQYEVLVDGTNGDTTLKPVKATLGGTHFTTSGVVFKHEGDKHRSIHLNVDMPQGRMTDILRLAMKGAPFMEGRLNLKTALELPNLDGKVIDKLRLDGKFDITGAHFLKSTIQDQIDGLSRRGRGQPQNQEIDEVVSRMQGDFKLDGSVITFGQLTFGVSGADVHLAGSYALDDDVLDFHGALRLQAKVSQTQTGWKHWVLKPVDPFLSNHGAGTYLKIQVVGSSKAPKFGRDKGPSEQRP